MSRVAEQMAERRERILEAAREIIAERGFEAITVRELAEAAGVTVPTIYNLIGNKDQVLVAAVADQTERFVRGIERAAGDVIAVVDANVRELLRVPRYYRSLLQILLTSEAARPARRTVRVALGTQLRTALGELAEDGGVAEWVDLEALTEQIQGALAATSTAWANGQLGDRELAARERYAVALLLLGVTRGAAHDEYLRIARESQPGAPPREAARVMPMRRRR